MRSISGLVGSAVECALNCMSIISSISGFVGSAVECALKFMSRLSCIRKHIFHQWLCCFGCWKTCFSNMLLFCAWFFYRIQDVSFEKCYCSAFCFFIGFRPSVLKNMFFWHVIILRVAFFIGFRLSVLKDMFFWHVIVLRCTFFIGFRASVWKSMFFWNVIVLRFAFWGMGIAVKSDHR